MSSLNGVAINHLTAGPEARGFEVHSLVISDTQGSITLLLAYNFTSSSAVPPFYPRSISGYVHSKAATGAYSQLRFEGNISGAITPGPPPGRTVIMNALVDGRLYSLPANSSRTRTAIGSRVLPPIRTFTLFPGDLFAQFTRPDYVVGTAGGGFTPNSVYTGNLQDEHGLAGTMYLDNAQLLAGSLRDFSPGWTAGNLHMIESQGTAYGVFLADQNGPTPNGYYFQVGGTGSYDGGLMFGQMLVSIGYQGGEDLIATILGSYCTDFAPNGATATPTSTIPSATPTPPATSTAVATAPASATPTPPATATIVATATATSIPPTALPTLTRTATPLPSVTAPPATATSVVLTATPTWPAPTSTPTCAIAFSDVSPGSPFYQYVRSLACRGVISGYSDGTFRPNNNTTRGQLSKIVALAQGWTIYTPPSPTFSDVPATDTFYSYIETAYHHGIISGYTCGTGCLEFRPTNNVTRGQVSKIVVLAQQWAIYTPPNPTFSDVPTSDPFYTYIETAYSHAIISGYICGPACLEFRPGNNATRGQICKIVYLAVTSP